MPMLSTINHRATFKAVPRFTTTILSSHKHQTSIPKPQTLSSQASRVRYHGTLPSKRSPLTTMASATTFFDFKPADKRGQSYSLEQLKGKVVLVVNTASKCGFTPQFEGLEKLYKDLKAEHPNDFEILGFPCNQFGGQDPGKPVTSTSTSTSTPNQLTPLTRLQRRNPRILPTKLRRLLPRPRQNRCKRRHRRSHLPVAEKRETRSAGPAAHKVEF